MAIRVHTDEDFSDAKHVRYTTLIRQRKYLSLGKISHTFGARNNIGSVPSLTDLTLCLPGNLFP